uniref:hypothetical protein n=1 Tax=Galdieria phlegrea TaxID=1389228 RepID=UPI0023D85BBE|nr:hypothetical protein P2030_pgp108 [Galdieria phlegrea]WDA99831.1 hypothetical protein GAPH629S_099 [Galdieria phlegrea]
MNTYYILIGNKQFLLNYEPVEEILRERHEDYLNKKKSLDFKVVIDENFFNSEEIKNVKNLIPKEPAAIISNDLEFINWLNLRLNYVIKYQIQTDKILI